MDSKRAKKFYFEFFLFYSSEYFTGRRWLNPYIFDCVDMICCGMWFQIENVMKQGRQALLAGESRTVSLHKEYTPLRKELNDLRKEVNLDAVAESEIDDLDLSSIKYVSSYSKQLLHLMIFGIFKAIFTLSFTTNVCFKI